MTIARTLALAAAFSAAIAASAAIAQKLVDEFATKYKKTVVKSDRAAFKAAFTPFHLGPDATWDKALYDKVQAIK